MSARTVQLMGENRVVADVDDTVGFLVILDAVHHWIHEGLLYQADFFAAAVANNASIEALVRVPAGFGAHMRFSAGVGGDARGFLFENPTVTVDGTALTRNNRNRRSANTANTLAFHTPTTTDDGTQIAETFIPAGRGGNAIGGDQDSFEEWILKEDEEYLLRITNVAGTAQNLFLALDWYEPGPPVVQHVPPPS